MDRNLQPLLYKTMADAAFYPHAAGEISCRETHISMVYLTGEYVYKVKKPVDLGFVNFKELEKRLHFCEQEVRLNQRLTSGIYLAVVPISYDGQQFLMGGYGEIVEYAVKMRQLPFTRTLAHLLDRNAVQVEDLERLAAKLAAFHRNAPRVVDQPIWSYVKSACHENFSQVQPYEVKILDAPALTFVRQATDDYLQRHQPLFDHRTASGRIRDGHGDLRTEHVYLTEKHTIQILDCIEFNDRLRRVDAASDLAFLAMDLEFRGYPGLARVLLEAYCRKSGDAELPALMEFYKCYRAMVRCKVNCIQLSNAGNDHKQRKAHAARACRYLALAHKYAQRMVRPTLWIICGLPGTGKTTVASKLAQTLYIPALSSDLIRKKIFGLAPHDNATGPVDQGIYSPGANENVYAHMLKTARQNILAGYSVILDATYRRSAHRRKVRCLAAESGAYIFFIECKTDRAHLYLRLRQREKASSVSDARWHHLESIKTQFDPLNDIPGRQHMVLDTTAAPDDCMRQIIVERYLHRMEEVSA